ncbi:hypothetical protein [Nocardia sp. N2S4-5]
MRPEVFAGIEHILRQRSRAPGRDRDRVAMPVRRDRKPLVVRRVAGDRG